VNALVLEQVALHRGADRIVNRDPPAHPARFADHALPRQPMLRAARLQRSRRDARAAWQARQLGDLAVGRDRPARNPPDDRIDPTIQVAHVRIHGATLMPVRIRVLYFAVFRERLARDEEVIDVPAGATVADAIALLAERHAPIAQLRGKFRVAVDQEFVNDTHAQHDNAELALIPPVAGGMGGHHVVLTDQPLSLDRCLAAVKSAGYGGIVTFTGMVRLHSHGATIDHLEYEAYAPMAMKVMTRLCEEIEAEIAGAHVAVEHRVGHLAIGEIAVVIAAAAPHRAEAFAACRAMIDRLKDRVPIWKKEVSVDGESWVGLGP
jgi:molybdopterin converting factor subunit 1